MRCGNDSRHVCFTIVMNFRRSKDAKVFGRPEVELWFAESQLQRGALSETGQPGDVAHWFHGQCLDPVDVCSRLN